MGPAHDASMQGLANLNMVSYDCGVCFQASFVASGNRTDIALDDPNFWDKWAKKADIDMDMVNGRVSVFSNK